MTHEVRNVVLWLLRPPDEVLRLERASGLERQRGHREQLHAALPLLLSEQHRQPRERL